VVHSNTLRTVHSLAGAGVGEADSSDTDHSVAEEKEEIANCELQNANFKLEEARKTKLTRFTFCPTFFNLHFAIRNLQCFLFVIQP
jgi:hypothetical protein